MVLDEGDDVSRLADDLVHALAVRELAQEGRGAEQDVDARDAGLHGDARVVHVTAHVREDLRAKTERGDRPQVLERLRRRDRRRELDVLDPERVQRLGDLDLLFGGEVRVRELLALAERRVDDREALDRHRRPPSSPRRCPHATGPFENEEARQRLHA